MDLCFDSCSVMTQDAYACAPATERKARPAGIILDQNPILAYDQQSPVDAQAVSPDFDSRPISPVSDSDCSESLQSTDDTTTCKTVGFGRKRHSVFPTVRPTDDIAPSKIVGFGRKQHHYRHSVSGAPASSAALDRKKEHRRSLPAPVITRDGPSLADSNYKLDYRVSMDVGSATLPVFLGGSSDKRPGAARRVSNNSSGTTRQPPKPLLLPQQVQAHNSPIPPAPGRVGQSLTSVVSRPIEFIVGRSAGAALETRQRRTPSRRGKDQREEEPRQAPQEALPAVARALKGWSTLCISTYGLFSRIRAHFYAPRLRTTRSYTPTPPR
ncbi:hypothetical protein B0H19DRAFT_607110 [Mycena capillaripes]|nr:hypothetical protein B0H19DRAFT_607110 [Mycena capillaripes]